jgi:hypothetical protein
VDAKDNDLMYREATIYALSGDVPEALKSLQAALASGYSVLVAKSDPELGKLRETPGFADLLQQVTRKAPRR